MKAWQVVLLLFVVSLLLLVDASVLGPVTKMLGDLVGSKPMSLGEAKGVIPEEVYKLARTRYSDSTRCIVFDSGEVWVWDWRPVEGTYVEKVGDKYRVTVVYWDEQFAKKYLIIKVEFELNATDYVVDDAVPSYLKIKETSVGKWEFRSYEKINGENVYHPTGSGEVVYFKIVDPNPEDKRIARTLANQIKKYAVENNLTREQIVLLAFDLAESAIRGVWKYTYAKPFAVKAYVNGELHEIKVNRTDSLLKAILLKGESPCFGRAFLAIALLKSLGIEAYELTSLAWEGMWHADVMVPWNILKDPRGKPIKIMLNGVERSFTGLTDLSVESKYVYSLKKGEKIYVSEYEFTS